MCCLLSYSNCLVRVIHQPIYRTPVGGSQWNKACKASTRQDTRERQVECRTNYTSKQTVLEVGSSTLANEQRISSESHALLVPNVRHAAYKHIIVH